jgi:hypothetical protein
LTPRARWLAVYGAALLFAWALVSCRFAAPTPRGPDAPPHEFSAARAYADLARILDGVGPHPLGSPANDDVRERIAARLGELGFSVERQVEAVCPRNAPCTRATNLIALRGGGDALVLLAAHYDSVAKGPGASDDGVGVAVLLETARALGDATDQENGVAFLFSDGEEAGLLGAKAFVDRHPLAARVAAVINVDNRGTSGPSLMFELAGPSSELVPLLDELPRPFSSSLFGAVYEALPNDTDFTRLRERGAVGYNFAFIGDVQNYHTERDTLANVSHASLQHHGDNALALARRLAHEDLSRLRQGHRVVWFDWLGLGVVRWNERLSPALAMFAVALVAAVAALGARGRRDALRVALRGSVEVIALMLASALAGAVLVALLWATSPLPIPLHPAKWLPISAVAVGTLGLATLLSPRAPGAFWLEFAGRWGLLALLGLALAVFFAPGSYALVPAVLVAGVVGTAGAWLRLEGERAAALAAVPSFFLATVWLQLGKGFVAAVDILALPVVGITAALLLATAAPQQPRPARRVAWAMLGGAGVLSLVAIVAGMA